MGFRAVIDGLGESPFLADVDSHDREPSRIFATLAGGLAVGLFAAAVSFVAVALPYALVTGPRGSIWESLGRLATRLDDPKFTTPGFELVREALTAPSEGVFLLAFVMLAAWIDQHRFGAYMAATPTPRWRLWAAGMVLSALALTPLIIADPQGLAASPFLNPSTRFGDRILYLFAALLLAPGAALEELFFRGWLIRQTAAFTRKPLVLLVGPALLFSAMHLDPSGDAFVMRVLMGAGFAYMTLRTGGIELSSGAHAMNNMLFVLLVGTDDAGDGIPALARYVIVALGYVAVTEAVMRAPRVRTWLGPQAPQPA
jgi:uncharacterized protein